VGGRGYEDTERVEVTEGGDRLEHDSGLVVEAHPAQQVIGALVDADGGVW
jgi:hypothetical protein